MSVSLSARPLNIVWFRNDLRYHDNAALHAAVNDALNHPGTAVIALFIATPVSWQQHDMALIKQDLIRRRVLQLKHELAELNIPLLAIEGHNYAGVNAIFQHFLPFGLRNVFAQTEYEIREQQRDQHLNTFLAEQQVECHWFDTQCIMPPGSVRTQQGDIYKVFTPFKRNWLQQFMQAGVHCLPKVRLPEVQDLTSITTSLPEMLPPAHCSADWPVAEKDILGLMRTFCREGVQDYHQNRDFPAIKGTSGLSAYLAIGVLSPQQCVSRLLSEQAELVWLEGSGAAVWLTELIWREFYKHILVAFPMLIKHQPFQQETMLIAWRDDQTLFQAWCDGRTGYPIVDAAMRQLNQTGWMHNRLRMIAASFLVKDLHIDWRWGEQYFMSRLIDGDFAANNGGWQWAASTGTDAVPYFRIFNPVTQGKRFDPEGDFLRCYLPELKLYHGKNIHWPHTDGHYITPVVDHAEARKVTLALFSQAKQQFAAMVEDSNRYQTT